MEIYNQVISMFNGQEGKEFSAEQIKSMIAERYNTNIKSIIPSDYCYNRLNKGSSPYFLFERIGYGRYRYLGEKYPYTGDIYARPQGAKEDLKVGYWEKGDPNYNHFVQSEDDDNSYCEGREAFGIHRSRERKGELPKLKKQIVFKNVGSLKCEICRFDFAEEYGRRGDGFIECHHNKPVSQMQGEQKVSIDDLSLLCSNCHRIIHRHKPWISVNELREMRKHE